MQHILHGAWGGKLPPTFTSLKRWNVVLAPIYIVQALAILILSLPKNFPVDVSFLTPDSVQTLLSAKPVTGPATHQILLINLTYVVAGFLFIAAIWRVLLATFYRQRYEAFIAKRLNAFRWIEYALTFSLVVLALGLLVGVYDLAILVLLGTLIITSCIVAYRIESQNAQNRQKKPFPSGLTWLAGVTLVVPLAIVGQFMWATNVFGSGRVPTYLYWLYVTVIFGVIGVGSLTYLLFRKKNAWANYLFGEMWYMGLNASILSLLAWQVFASVLHP